MILEEIKSYKEYLSFGYERVKWRKHLGVADKFLIKQKFNLEIIKEINVERVNYESKNKEKPSLDNIMDWNNCGISRAAKRVFLENQEYF